jgi:hypothetical protein
VQLWLSIQHNAWSFEVSENVSMWVPRELKDREKMNQTGLSLKHLLQYADEGEDILNRTVTEEESWVRHYQPKPKHVSMQWKHASSLSTKKFKVTPQAGKLCLLHFGIMREYC